MSHDSQSIQPLIFLAEDVHTIALINSWKFHWDWAKHLGANLWRDTETYPSPQTPLYTYAGFAGWMMETILPQNPQTKTWFKHTFFWFQPSNEVLLQEEGAGNCEGEAHLSVWASNEELDALELIN